MALVRGVDAFGVCNDAAIHKLFGMLDKTIYVTYNAYMYMSLDFRRECVIRNLNIEIIDNP